MREILITHKMLFLRSSASWGHKANKWTELENGQALPRECEECFCFGRAQEIEVSTTRVSKRPLTLEWIVMGHAWVPLTAKSPRHTVGLQWIASSFPQVLMRNLGGRETWNCPRGWCTGVKSQPVLSPSLTASMTLSLGDGQTCHSPDARQITLASGGPVEGRAICSWRGSGSPSPDIPDLEEASTTQQPQQPCHCGERRSRSLCRWRSHRKVAQASILSWYKAKFWKIST